MQDKPPRSLGFICHNRDGYPNVNVTMPQTRSQSPCCCWLQRREHRQQLSHLHSSTTTATTTKEQRRWIQRLRQWLIMALVCVAFHLGSSLLYNTGYPYPIDTYPIQFVKVGYAGSDFPEHGTSPTTHLQIFCCRTSVFDIVATSTQCSPLSLAGQYYVQKNALVMLLSRIS